MADGDVFQLVRGVLGPVDRFLDYLFYAGVAYGIRSASRILYQCFRGFRIYFIPFGRVSGKNLAEKYGKWAVITGGTSALGLAYAHEFARRNVNIVLISRSYDDLVSIISELQTMYEDIQTYGIYADFSLGSRVYQDVEEALKDMEIGILVNNVSIRYDHPQYFSLVPHQRMWQVVDANVTAITVMTHMLLPHMLKRQRGAIINVASVSSCTPPVPLTAEYTASMAYVDSFSQALHYENRRKGICVQTLLPCTIARPGSSLPTFFSPSPETYVRHAMASLGVSHRSCGYWPHAIQSWLWCVIPEWLWVWLTMYYNTATRRRCLSEAMDNNTPMFTRTSSYLPRVIGGGRHGSSSSTTATASGRQSTDLTFRRTPSPQRRKPSADVVADSPSPNTQRRDMRRVSNPVGGGGGGGGVDRVRKISLEESVFPLSRSRMSSGGPLPGAIPPIQEDSSPSTTPLSTPEAGQVQDGASLFLPRRSSSASAAEGPLKRYNLMGKRTSRVLVMPSVAQVSHSLEMSSSIATPPP